MALSSELSESCGSTSSKVNKYIIVGDTVRQVNRSPFGILKFLQEAFLPQGYPDSVSEDYLRYQFWDTVQAFCSYITGTLATQAVLKGVGVGDSAASPAAATVTWILKDGLGMVGRIVFAWLKGTDLDCNAKKWRLVADILNDVALCLELLAGLIPGLFMTIICIAGATKAIVGVAGGATRAALVQHQAKRDNMADVSAKDGSQETLVNLLGLVVGLVLTPLVAGHNSTIWLLFAVFTVLHLFANYCAVSAVSMETFNQNRLHIVVKEYLKSGTVLPPKIANSKEPVLSGVSRKYKLNLACSLEAVLLNKSDYESAYNKYVDYAVKSIVSTSTNKSEVNISYHDDSSVNDQLMGVVTAEIFENITSYNAALDGTILSLHAAQISRLEKDKDLLALSEKLCREVFATLLSSCEGVGWDTSHHQLGLREWRYKWN